MATARFDHYKNQLVIAKGTVLLLLAMGALSPIFRHDSDAMYVSFGCIVGLAALAGVKLLNCRKEAGKSEYKWFGKPMTRVRRGGWVQTYDLKHERMMQTFESADGLIIRSFSLILLFGFALISNFRTEIEFQCLAAVCVIALTTLAGFTLFRRQSP